MFAAHALDRRGFIRIVLTFLGTVMGAVVGLPAIGYLLSPAIKTQKSESWISVGPLEKYPVGSPTLFSFTRTRTNGWEKTVSSYGVYVLRLNEQDARAYSNMCTHLSCRVSWKEEEQAYICPCHDARFDREGNVTAGPPPTPLIRYETKIEAGNLFIHLLEG